jgi:hypothetical protein
VKKYRTILFWFGGVLTGTLGKMSEAVLFPQVSGRQAVDFLIELRTPAEQLILGNITPAEYCRKAAELCGSELSPEEIEKRIGAAARLQEKVFQIVADIPEEYERWLVVDFPMEWYSEWATRWKINSVFPENRVIITAGMKLPRLVPEVFYHLPASVGKTMDECLIIDPEPSRAVKAMRHKLASIIYVYPQRLVHELALQGIWQTDADVMHPTSSERVNI